MKVNNLSATYKNYRYVIIRTVDGEDWYYGATNDFGKAVNIAYSFDNGHVICTEKVEIGWC